MKFTNIGEKRQSKTHLTKGAFGVCKNIPDGYDEKKMKVVPRSKRTK